VPNEVTAGATAESSKLKFLWIPAFAEVTASKSNSSFYKLPQHHIRAEVHNQ
jgi:hypothetical protein